MVKVKLVAPFNGILTSPNALMITGGATTVRAAVEVLPVNPPTSVEVPVTLLFFSPPVVPVTLTEIVQDAAGAKVAPVKLTLDETATAVVVPPHVLVKPFGVATIKPAGSASVNATPFSVKLTLVLLSVKVRLVEPFRGIVTAPKAFAIVGGLMTVMLADAGLALVSPPASVAVTLLEVLFCTPSVTPLTSTDIVQLVLIPTVPPEKLKVAKPGGAVTVPPHPLTTLGVKAIDSPPGRTSVKARPFKEFAVLGLVMVKVRVLTPFTGI